MALYSVWQRYNFESNLQRVDEQYPSGVCCIQYDKDTILKAIYNSLQTTTRISTAVFSMTKIQFWKQFTTPIQCAIHQRTLYSVWQRYNFESNLQHFGKTAKTTSAVFSMTKIQFWKQFTTDANKTPAPVQLYSVWQRYNFESNLQRTAISLGYTPCCIQYDKDTILKAIYNPAIYIMS